jgi:nucleoid-associated protein YgaU
VAGGGASTKIYKVKTNDTLKSIAEKQLGDAKRWPEIFVLNRDKIRHRDRLTVGSVFSLPGPTPILPRPTLHRTKSGDTLSKMADRLLGDANRWPEIQRLNRDVVPNPSTLPVGLDLVVVRD